MFETKEYRVLWIEDHELMVQSLKYAIKWYTDRLQATNIQIVFHWIVCDNWPPMATIQAIEWLKNHAAPDLIIMDSLGQWDSNQREFVFYCRDICAFIRQQAAIIPPHVLFSVDNNDPRLTAPDFFPDANDHWGKQLSNDDLFKLILERLGIDPAIVFSF